SVLIAACRIPYTADTTPMARTSHHHQRGPPPSRSNPTRMMPYAPRLTMAADISAETWLGASGCARGSHACSGTAPALDEKPTSVVTNTVADIAGDSPPAASRSAANPSSGA